MATPLPVDTLQRLAEARRLAVTGYGGKTTLARALARKYGLTHIELDALFWDPGWQGVAADEFLRRINHASEAAGGAWVSDGNYISKGGALIKQADVVILVNPPWRVMFWRMFKRSVKRLFDRTPICGDNRESFRHTFLSRESLLWWHITMRGRYRQQSARVRQLVMPEALFIELGSAREINRFYESLGIERP